MNSIIIGFYVLIGIAVAKIKQSITRSNSNVIDANFVITVFIWPLYVLLPILILIILLLSAILGVVATAITHNYEKAYKE